MEMRNVFLNNGYAQCKSILTNGNAQCKFKSKGGTSSNFTVWKCAILILVNGNAQC